MSLFNVFKSFFISRVTRNPMIGLAWWLWGLTPANRVARLVFALACFAGYRHRHQIMKIMDDPYQSFTEFIKKAPKKRAHVTPKSNTG